MARSPVGRSFPRPECSGPKAGSKDRWSRAKIIAPEGGRGGKVPLPKFEGLAFGRVIRYLKRFESPRIRVLEWWGKGGRHGNKRDQRVQSRDAGRGGRGDDDQLCGRGEQQALLPGLRCGRPGR